jgi:hypothetical protein
MFRKWSSYYSDTNYNIFRPTIIVCNVQQTLEFSGIFPAFSADHILVYLEEFITGDCLTKIRKHCGSVAMCYTTGEVP